MKHDAFSHPKFTLAARDLGIPLGYLRGIIMGLWHLADTRFPQGDIGRFTNEELAIAAEHDQDPDQVVEVLIRRRLLDVIPDEQGRLYIHNWHVHCQDFTRQKVRNRGGSFANGAPAYGRKNAPESTPDQTVTENRREPQRTTENNGTARPGAESLSRAVPEPEPEPEPETTKTGARFEEGASSPSPPSEMPDGTLRLTGGEFEALDGLRRDFTDALVLSSAVQVKFRKLIASGATIALIDEMVREAALAQRRKHGSKWRASRLDYFEPAVRRRLDELRCEATAAPAEGSRPPPDPEQRSIRRAALLRAATRGREDDFTEGCGAFGAWLEGLGWNPAEAGREVAAVAAEVRAEARSLRGTANGRVGSGDRSAGPADVEPAHSGG